MPLDKQSEPQQIMMANVTELNDLSLKLFKLQDCWKMENVDSKIKRKNK